MENADGLEGRMTRYVDRSIDSLRSELKDHYATKEQFVEIKEQVADCEKSTDTYLTALRDSESRILGTFDRAVVPAIKLQEQLLTTTTRLREAETQIAVASVETKTQTTQTTQTITVSPIPPFWTIIKAWCANISVIGGAFLTLVAIAIVIIGWWIWSVQHTPRP